MCLQKILRVITSCPPQEISKETSLNREILEFKENRGVDIDLNMGLSPAWSEADNQENQSSEESSLLSACSFVEKGIKNDSSMEVFAVDRSSSVGECCVKVVGDQVGYDSPTVQATGEESQGVDETTLEISKTTNLKNQPNEISSKIKAVNDDQEITKFKEEDTKKESVKLEPCHEEKNESNKDSLALLIEAAEMFSGNLEDKESDSEKLEETTSGSKKSCKCSWVVDLYEDNTSSPVVRSKRGRTQVLPYRYRDSSVLLEPWKRLPRPTKADTTAATVVSKKRK
jgi:hypothetical protein